MFSLDTYTIYAQWCRDLGKPVPTREWWEAACLKRTEGKIIYRDLRKDQEEIDTERREGWDRG